MALSLRLLEETSLARLAVSGDAATVLSDPGLNTVRFHGDFENSSSLTHSFGSIAAKTCLATISKVNALVLAPVIIVVVVTARDPLNCFLLN
jgi:hypothetical protein